MSKPFRGVIMRLVEVEFEIWADDIEDALKRYDEEKNVLSEVTYADELVDMIEHAEKFQC